MNDRQIKLTGDLSPTAVEAIAREVPICQDEVSRDERNTEAHKRMKTGSLVTYLPI